VRCGGDHAREKGRSGPEKERPGKGKGRKERRTRIVVGGVGKEKNSFSGRLALLSNGKRSAPERRGATSFQRGHRCPRKDLGPAFTITTSTWMNVSGVFF